MMGNRASKWGDDEPPHCSLSLRNESSTAGSGSRAQGSLSMLSPSRPSGSMRSSSSSPNSNPAAETSNPGTPARAAAISLEKPGEESPVWAEEMGEDPSISYCAANVPAFPYIPHDHPHFSPVRMMLGPEPWREQWVKFWWLRA